MLMNHRAGLLVSAMAGEPCATNWNLSAVAFTILPLGMVAVFNIIPGPGYLGGIALLAIGGTLLIGDMLRTWRRSVARQRAAFAS